MPLNLPTYDVNGLDRDEIMAQLLACLPNVLRHIFPAGRIRGSHFEIGNIRGDKGQSLKVTICGDKAGLWYDFEGGTGGDIFDLWAIHYGMDAKGQFPDVLKSISDYLGTAPVSSAFPSASPTTTWNYLDIHGQIIATVHRYDTGSGKAYRPWDTYAGKWQMPNPRPLYNLPGIAVANSIVFVEGEKAAQALIDYGVHATTVMGGANSPMEKTDWQPLAGKNVTIWPDNDAAGRHYAEMVRKALVRAGASSISIVVIPDGKPEKWDAADAVTEDGTDIMALLQASRSMESTTPYKAYSIESLLNDPAPMPADLISKRLLTPGGLLVIGGAPKVGKSDFVLSLLVHMAAGEPFLGFEPSKPLRILYLQAEIQKPYLIERLRKMRLPEQLINRSYGNLFITPQMKLLLNESGLEVVMQMIADSFGSRPPEIIVIDPIRNLFDGGPDDNGLGENDNNAMLFFLQQRVERIRDEVNPDAGMILIHHTRKLGKNQFKEDPFQALSGASALRGYYSSGLLIFRPDETIRARQLFFELRNGPGIDPFYIDKINDQWEKVDQNQVRLVRDSYGKRLDAERYRQRDVIVQMLLDEALEGRLYVAEQFCSAFEGKAGLGSHTTIQNRIKVLMTKGFIKSFKAPHPRTGIGIARSKFGYLCVEHMMLGPEAVDEKTGEVVHDLFPIKPTHYMHVETGHLLEVENHDVWVYQDDDGSDGKLVSA